MKSIGSNLAGFIDIDLALIGTMFEFTVFRLAGFGTNNRAKHWANFLVDRTNFASDIGITAGIAINEAAAIINLAASIEILSAAIRVKLGDSIQL